MYFLYLDSITMTELIYGQIVIDKTIPGALLVRKKNDGGDVFSVDTTNSVVAVTGDITVSGNTIITGQLTSNVTTGTPPLVIASTTNVANLNASSLSGATFASPGPIGSVTPSTGSFTNINSSLQLRLNNDGGNNNGILLSTTQDVHPTVHFVNFAHDNSSILFDAYYGSDWTSSSSNSNFGIFKSATKLSFNYASGVAAGSTTSVHTNTALDISETGIVTISKSLTSTVTTGTAPLVIASTTNVVNLNASSLSGATFGSPGPIGSATQDTGDFTSVNINSTTTVGGTVNPSSSSVGGGSLDISGDLVVASDKRLFFSQDTSSGPPTLTSRSIGTRLVLYPAISVSGVDFAIGIESSTMWQSVSQASHFFKWYGATTNIATLDGTGNMSLRQYTSTVTTGTAPLVIASTTNVVNLNASTLSGATFGDPGPIGSVTPSTGEFTSVNINSTTTVGGTVNPITSSGGALNVGGDLVLGTTTPRIYFPNNGVGTPSITNRSAGTKIVLYSEISSIYVDYAIGIGSGIFWNSVPDQVNFFKWYGGTTNIATLDGTGNMSLRQYTSTVTTGTAPLVIASTTNVVNLNASSLSGATFGVPGPIGSVTPSTGSFTNINSSLQLRINNDGGNNNGILLSTTQDVHPTVHFVNFAHDSTAILFDAYYGSNWTSSSINSNFGIFKSANSLSFNYASGVAAGSNTSVHTNTALGISATGFVTISKSLTSTVTTGTAPLVIASTTNVVNLNASSLSGATFGEPGPIGSGTPSSGSFSSLVVNGQQSSTILSPVSGTVVLSHDGSSGSGALGASLVFSQKWSSGNPSYIGVGQISGIKLSNDGNFGGGLVFSTSNLTTNNYAERMRITNSGVVEILATTDSLSTTTGALTVAGGVGIEESVTIGGSINSGTILPIITGTYNLGSASLEWLNVYSQNAVTVSDRNKKSEIIKETLGLDFINELEPSSYIYKSNGAQSRGLIAQDLEKVCERYSIKGLVSKEEKKASEDGTKEYDYGIVYTQLISILIKSIQELSEKVKHLEEKSVATESHFKSTE
jgi:hypothetical protein